MATGNSRNKRQRNYDRDIVLNGRISPEVQCSLVKDILKFLLYHRDQIPLPFDQLKYYFERQENIKKGSEANKLGHLLENVQDFCDNLDNIFSQPAPVDSVLILIGPTLATPKETFKIHFTNDLFSEPLLDVPSTKLCSRLLHKSLVTYNALIDTTPPPISSLHILFQGQRSSNIQWFKPKLSFKIPKRGQYFTFHILSNKQSSSSSSSSGRKDHKGAYIQEAHERGDFTISGANNSICERAGEDLIWYAAPNAIKGVKDTVLCVSQQEETWVQ